MFFFFSSRGGKNGLQVLISPSRRDFSSFESVNRLALASLYRYRDRMLKGLFSLGNGLSDRKGREWKRKERNARKEKKKRT